MPVLWLLSYTDTADQNLLSPVFPDHGHEADPHPFAPTLAGMHFVYQIFVTNIFIRSIWILSLQNQVGLKVALKFLAPT